MEAATGERIVAFGRVGKPLETTFCGRFAPSSKPGDSGTGQAVQRILKPHGVGL
jgi:hypothetical protein